jgi:L-ribulose-5-phosphate 4-epimerase
LSKWQREKNLVLETAQKMLEKGLVTGTAGNVSLRLPPEEGRPLLAITPSSRYYDSLGIDDIQIIDFEAQTIEGNLPPSIETALHIGIYQARKNVNAVIHTHSVFASAIAVAGLDIPAILDDQVAFLGGEIRLAKHALAGSQKQVMNTVAALEDRSAVLLPNHGAVGTGRTMRQAFIACELIEKTARIYLLAMSTGKVNLMPAEVLEVEKSLYDRLQSVGD